MELPATESIVRLLGDKMDYNANAIDKSDIYVEQRRKQATKDLKQALEDGFWKEIEEKLWEALLLFQGFTFKTAKNLEFHYIIKGNEIFFDRKEKSVTRATANLALKKAMELKKSGIQITGPKKLGCFGASYLYPVFIRIGVIDLPVSLC
jgi:type I site-specific restriction-modification system R (restriction) subunit